MFEKKGRIQFRSGQSGSSMEDMMDLAIDAGAEDMQELEDNSVEVKGNSSGIAHFCPGELPKLRLIPNVLL
jgi:transcriptional/translational regulatory protein YebC/TACO1